MNCEFGLIAKPRRIICCTVISSIGIAGNSQQLYWIPTCGSPNLPCSLLPNSSPAAVVPKPCLELSTIDMLHNDSLLLRPGRFRRVNWLRVSTTNRVNTNKQRPRTWSFANNIYNNTKKKRRKNTKEKFPPSSRRKDALTILYLSCVLYEYFVSVLILPDSNWPTKGTICIG